MITFPQALGLILDNVVPLGTERVPLSGAAGRIVSEEIVAPWDMPRADNSAMDGYAVRSRDCAGPVALPVLGCTPAGLPPFDAPPTPCAVRIMTGAPVPQGFDAVIPIEDVEESGTAIRIRGPVPAGAHVRFRAEDLRAGDRVIATGAVLRPPEIGLLASFGRAVVPVRRRPRVALLSTGDELVELGETVPEGAIVNSNSHALSAAVLESGGVPVPLGIARDTRASLREKLLEGLAHDALVTSAGVSMGDKDLVREVLRDLGVRELFWKLPIRPGHPVAFGVREGTPVFSLPGNPVSSMITFEELVRPALRRMGGHPLPVKTALRAALAEPVRKKEGRLQFYRVSVAVAGGRLVAHPAGDQSTGIVRTLARSNAVALLPADRTSFERGEDVEVHLLYPGWSTLPEEDAQ